MQKNHITVFGFLLLYITTVMAQYAEGTLATEGFQNAPWGSKPDQVKSVIKASSWNLLPPENAFPDSLRVTRYATSETIAGYPAAVTYYFWEEKFFQATVTFNFDKFKTYDFNYNVFRSVDGYYTAIHDQTLTFVADIYKLLQKKYGKKRPVFKGLDPRDIFKKTDVYLKQERWNLRYNPSEYYKRIITAAYALWDFPKTRVVFSINISASDKRFDYQLSATSLDLEGDIEKKKDALRMRGL
jgi:hypothetical protein